MKMSGEYLLDSNVIIDLFRGDQQLIPRISRLKEIIIPAIVLGELYAGANKSNQTARRLKEIASLEKLATILGVTSSTATVYGKIKDQLRLAGKPIPENDIWIASISVEHHQTLVTRDNHFELVAGLTLEKW